MAVSLYTVRVIWQVLGVDDYGIYNVVGGIVLMFAFLNTAMVVSSQRFISFELGRGDNKKLNRVFCISVTVHVMLAGVILLLAETIGLWFLNYELNIPPGRMVAANWVYQCSVIAFCVTIISVPYNACIVAHEHMKAYGYFGILEVVMKLLIVFLLMLAPFDKLITYAVLVLSVSLIMRLIFTIYCKRHFEECTYKYVKDKGLMSDMFAFAGWSLIGNLGFALRDQGLNILINLFFNVAVNAAKGIASQIGGVISGFAQNFQMALNPQITKRYAAGETESMIRLVFSGCKYSVFLMMCMAIPLTVAAKPVLMLWLGDLAPYTVGFVQLTLLLAVIESIVSPITTALQATGKIKRFQILISIVMISNLPLAWVWLHYAAYPYAVMFVSGATALFAVGMRLWLLHGLVSFSYRAYFVEVVGPIATIFLLASILSIGIYGFFSRSIFGLCAYGMSSVALTGITIYFIGLKPNEKQIVGNAVKKTLARFGV